LDTLGVPKEVVFWEMFEKIKWRLKHHVISRSSLGGAYSPFYATLTTKATAKSIEVSRILQNASLIHY